MGAFDPRDTEESTCAVSSSDGADAPVVRFGLADHVRHAVASGRYAAIAATLAAIDLAGLARIAPDRLRGRGAILTLHHVRPAEPGRFRASPHLEVAPDFLDALIRRLLRLGCEPIALADVPTRLAAPDDGRRFVAFTLDDGYRDNLVHARPVFERHGVPFTVFATSGFVRRERTIWWQTLERTLEAVDDLRFETGDRTLRFACADALAKTMTFRRIVDWMATVDEDESVAVLDRVAADHGVSAAAVADELVMTPDELRALARSPLATIGAHTHAHPNLRRLDPDRLAREIRRGTDELAEILGTRPTVFAYPYGTRVSAGAREFAAARDFALAVTTTPGTLTAAHLGRLTALPRISINGLFQRTGLVEALLSGWPLLLDRPRARGD